MRFEDLLEAARAREDFVGLYVFGSRGRSFMVDERSDLVAEQESLPAGRRDAIIREALDGYVNQTHRSLRRGMRLDAVEAIPYALRTIFALENRVRPYNKYLEWELRHRPLADWAADELLPLLDRVLAGEPDPQRDLFNRIEPLARRDNDGDVIDGWEPDVDWLRGEGEYRA